MLRIAFLSAALAGALLATQALASNSVWSPDPGRGVHTSHLTVFGAFARPEGDFGRTSSPGAAFAMPGAGLGLEYSIRTSRSIESGAVTLVDRYSIDNGALGASIAASLRQYGLASDPLVVSSEEWQVVWGLVKFGYAPQLREHLQVFVGVYGGASFGEYPEARLVTGPPGLSLIPRRDLWLGPAGGMGVGLRWRNHLSIGLLYLSGSTKSSLHGFDSGRQQISALHATLGYSFGH